VKSTVRVVGTRWRNWSEDLESRPTRLFSDEAGGPDRSPRTLEDLQRIVASARAAGVTVRAFGSSHSWAALVPNDGGYLVDNRMLGAIDGRFLPSIEPASPDGTRKARATVPAGVLSGEFESWLWEQGYTLPASAVEDCFSMGGMAATATHGTGLAFGTLSDMVVGATFVDGNARVRRWTRESASPDELDAIRCGLGCLGLVFDLTFEVEPRYEVLHEARSIDYASLFADSDQARRALRDLHEDHASVEFFWWPIRFSGIPFLSSPEINPEVWVLTTRRDVPTDARPRGPLRRFVHANILDLASMMFLGTTLNVVRHHPRRFDVLASIMCGTPTWVASRSGRWRMPQYDANHFINAGGVEFVLATAAEWSVPFRRHASLGDPEGYERVRRSYAVLHDLIVDAFHRYPLGDPRSIPITLALEMRTLAASSALLSPGYHANVADGDVAIAAPELVTTAHHPAWPEFARLAHRAMTAQPAIFGDEVRSHLAKVAHECPHPDRPDEGMRGFLRESYRAAGTWDRFLAVRERLDPAGVFLNPYLRAWFRVGERVAPTHAVRSADASAA